MLNLGEIRLIDIIYFSLNNVEREQMPYDIKPYSYIQAKKLNVLIFPSRRSMKKIDVYDYDMNYICSIGARGYSDYPSIKETNPRLAEEKRRLYHARHQKDESVKGTPGYYASRLLW